MRRFAWMCGCASLLLAGSMLAQAPDQPAGAGQGRGFGRGGFGQPVQGTVTAASGNKLTVKTEAGDSYTVTLGDNGRVMRDRQQSSLGDIKVGDSVTAMGQVDASAKTVQARMLNAIDAATVAKAKENLGKTYITGRVAAIDADNLKLTITRSDGASQVIAVDEGTSFQRGMRGVTADVEAAGGMPMGFGGGFGGRGGRGGPGGTGGQAGAAPAPESITLADVKVGDQVMATGSVKSGTFTVQKMGVAEPGMGPGGGRRGPGGADGPPGAPPPPGAGSPPPPPPQ